MNLKLLPIIALIIINACSFANKSTVTLPINSNPQGADVYIDGRNFGQTPIMAELTPNKNYKATISKRGYQPVDISLETWYSLRGGKSADGSRCLADVGSFVLPYFIVLLFAPEKCGSFKQDDYFVDLSGRASPEMDNSSLNYQNYNTSQQQNNVYSQPQNSQPQNYYSQPQSGNYYSQPQNNNYVQQQPTNDNNNYQPPQQDTSGYPPSYFTKQQKNQQSGY